MSYRPSSTPLSRWLAAHLSASVSGSKFVKRKYVDDGEV